MNQQLAREIFNAVAKTKLEPLKAAMLKKAIAYAHIRAEWTISDQATRIEMDIPRRIAHNTLIDSIGILARNMHQKGETTDWYTHLRDNRTEIAEFACWVHSFLSLKA